MQNLLEELKKLLTAEPKYLVDGELLKNKIIEDALKLEPSLIKLLLQNDKIKSHFFTDIVDGDSAIKIFDKIKFQDFVSNKAFLPDSYTAFRNKIGLSADNKFLKNSNDVVLNWAYKDCVLEGGMTKEDTKNNVSEIFYNETLAPDEINRLLDEKVLTNFAYWDEQAIKENKAKKPAEITLNDNLLIKGNNLLALHCLKRNYAGKVKLIYIDPPYNTGNDGFKYNDSFNHSSWLTFMKNRLEVARELLRDDGVIFVQISDIMSSKLELLISEIFEQDNFINKITVRTKSPSGFTSVNLGVFETAEYIYVFGKNKKLWKYNPQFTESSYDTNYKWLVENKNDKIEKWNIVNIFDYLAHKKGFGSRKEAENNIHKTAFKEMVADFAINNASSVFRETAIGNDAGKDTVEAREKSKKERDSILCIKRDNHPDRFIRNGSELAFYDKKIKIINGIKTPTKQLTNIWTDIAYEGIANEGGITLKKGKKPEKLLNRIMEMATDKNDIVLDFFSGSGTTPSVAHKMGRRWIAIEQMNYIKDLPEARLKKVIEGEQGGISKSINWQGGGSFVYCELFEWNEAYIAKIRDAKNLDDLLAIYKEMKIKRASFFRYDFESLKFDFEEFKTLELAEQKKILCEVLNKNHLYVNYSEMEDVGYKICDEDKKLTKSFYNKK
jgi:adenine-specific DNA-methyltransferase